MYNVYVYLSLCLLCPYIGLSGAFTSTVVNAILVKLSDQNEHLASSKVAERFHGVCFEFLVK